ncbi:hypothetical protein Rumeso_01579 [Rubellimicrobium mesophilum DSM 19309]|uniref:Glycosyltransferase 2-like domain-containing protein n=1 Tax=Rubellimicrobium mesophilum DSM 19309 TaxID=442562 RepID=A0A017HQH6_9RHOB|nr:hypothetical protein Rumeso_01579 [Rubellimicrobium mesophilum DSM 19309]
MPTDGKYWLAPTGWARAALDPTLPQGPWPKPTGAQEGQAGQMTVTDEDIATTRGSRAFDREWYCRQYPDVELSGIEPARHFARYGTLLGRSPSAQLPRKDYELEFPAAVGTNLVLHFEAIGRHLGYDIVRGCLPQDAFAGPGLVFADVARRPLVTVVMTAFNSEATVAAALGSLLTQSLKDIEVLVVDDKSTDRTADVVTGIAERDGRVRLIRLHANRGAYWARNLALFEARAPFIALSDSDDVSLPGRLEAQHAALSGSPYAAGLPCRSPAREPEGDHGPPPWSGAEPGLHDDDGPEGALRHRRVLRFRQDRGRRRIPRSHDAHADRGAVAPPAPAPVPGHGATGAAGGRGQGRGRRADRGTPGLRASLPGLASPARGSPPGVPPEEPELPGARDRRPRLRGWRTDHGLHGDLPAAPCHPGSRGGADRAAGGPVPDPSEQLRVGARLPAAREDPRHALAGAWRPSGQRQVPEHA